jgi:hypothetical protein
MTATPTPTPTIVAPSNRSSGAVDNGTAGNTIINCSSGSGLFENDLVILVINVLGQGVAINPPATDLIGGHPAWNLENTQNVNGDYEQEIFWHQIGSAETGGPSFMFTFGTSEVPVNVRAACAASAYKNSCLDSASACTDPIAGNTQGQSSASNAVSQSGQISFPAQSLVVAGVGTSDTNSKFGDGATNLPGTSGVPGKNQTNVTPNMSPVNGVSGNNGGIAIVNLTEIASGTDGPWQSLLPETGNWPTISLNSISGNGATATGVVAVTGIPLDQYQQTSFQAEISGVSTSCFNSTVGTPPQVTVTPTKITTTTNGSQTLPTGTLTVTSTTGFPSPAGTISVGTATSGGQQVVTCTGANTPTTFTSCTGGVGTIATGTTVTSPSMEFTYSSTCTGSGTGGTITIIDPGQGDNASQVLSIIPNLP